MKHLNALIILVAILSVVMCSCTEESKPRETLGKLEGTITDGKNPLDNVFVTLSETTESTMTNEVGYYVFDSLKVGSYIIHARKDGFRDTTIQVEFSKKVQQCNLMLTQKPPTIGEIKGTIVADSPQKFEGAYIVLFSENSGKQYKATDKNGNFQFDNIDYGNYELSIYAKGFIKLDNIQVSVPNGGNNEYPINAYKGAITFDVPYIDMGAITASNITAFGVLTGGNNDLEWEIKPDNNRTWLKSIEPKTGKGERTIIVEIDRSKIDINRKYNYAAITVASTTGNSYDKLLLTVTETGNGVNLANLVIQEEKISVQPTYVNIPCEILNLDIKQNGYEVGVIYSSTNPHPDDNDTRQKAEVNGSSYSVDLNLKANTHYWAIAYAYNAAAKHYYWGNKVIEFTTTSTPPAVGMPSVTATSRTATFSAAITNTGTPAYTERGFVYFITSNPDDSNKKPVQGKEMLYSYTATQLSPKTTYHVCAYITNGDNLKYSEEIVFTTKAELPELTTHGVENFTFTSATLTGSVVKDGNPAYTERGFCYATTPHPTTVNGKAVTTETYRLEITNLSEGIPYYVRTYAMTPDTTIYGNEVTFITPKRAILSTHVPTEITYTTLDVELNIVDVGVPPYTNRGICYYSTSKDPNITDITGDNIPIQGTGVGRKTATISGLAAGSIYYARAYAGNDKWTAYGNEVVLDLNLLPPAVVTSFSNVNNNSATMGGLIAYEGYPVYSECGITYSTTPNPIIELNKTALTADEAGTFNKEIIGLDAGTMYYVRAYAINAKGVAYGAENSFITTTPLAGAVAVQTTDLGKMSRTDAANACKNSTDGGYTTWRLPTGSELKNIYNRKSTIENLQNDNYWTSDVKSHIVKIPIHVTGRQATTMYKNVSVVDGYYSINLTNGEASTKPIDCNVRCVRTLP